MEQSCDQALNSEDKLIQLTCVRQAGSTYACKLNDYNEYLYFTCERTQICRRPQTPNNQQRPR
jgi:hypothetical protein